MNESNVPTSAKVIGTGLAFIIFPLIFLFAFATHPGLLNPHFLGSEELILRARNAELLHFGHALVTLNTALLVVVALHFMRLLENGTGAWSGYIACWLCSQKKAGWFWGGAYSCCRLGLVFRPLL